MILCLIVKIIAIHGKDNFNTMYYKVLIHIFIQHKSFKQFFFHIIFPISITRAVLSGTVRY